VARRPSLLVGTTGACLSLVAIVIGFGEPACCQDPMLFELPDRSIAKVDPPEGCKGAVERANAILPEVEKELDEALKASMRAAVAGREKDETLADGWHAAATVALLNAHPAAALWAELSAIKAEWSSDRMVQAGVYLALLKKDDDAKRFLHCAYDADNRSPYLLEALANIYRDTGDKPNAVRYIGEALAAAPEDPYIQLEKSLFNAGSMSRPQPPTDPVEASWAELKNHLNNQIAYLKRGEELFEKVQKINTPDWEVDAQALIASVRRSYDEGLASMADTKRMAQLTPAQFKQQFPGTPDSLRTQMRNVYFYSVVIYYLRTSQNMLQGPRAPTIDEGYDVGFWSQTLGKETIPYTRELKRLRDYEFDGTQLKIPGYTHDGWAGAYFHAIYTFAQKKRHEGHVACGQAHRSDPGAEERCRLEVDKKYCATVRKLHENWMNETEAHVQTIGRRFDRVASGMLVGAGEVAGDAFRYASKYTKFMNVAPSDTAGQGYVREINDTYRQIVADAVGDGMGGPSEVVRNYSRTYQIYKQNAETTIATYGRNIEEQCQPVDQRALEQLLEEQKEAVRQMLLERLIRDLNVSWNPNANCTFSMGKWISLKVDIDGNTEVKGKWSPYQKAFEGSPTFNVGDNFKFDIKDTRYISATAGIDKTRNMGPFTGSGGVNVGIQYDTKTGTVTYPVSINTKLGVGYKRKVGGQDFGFTCYPGELKSKFDARVIAKDVMDLYNAL
jgi:hypothetical protein